MSNRLELEDVSVSFAKPVFAGVSLTLRAAECVVLVGPSGCGKTSLLRAVAGVGPFSGTIRVEGESVEPGRTNPSVAYVTQTPALWDHLRVLDNIALVRRLSLQESRAEARAGSMAYLRQLEVDSVADRYPHSLSGGEQQRVALARGLAAERAILLLDEVTSSVDVARRAIIASAISGAIKREQAVLFVTHDLMTARDLPYPMIELSPSGLQPTNLRGLRP